MPHVPPDFCPAVKPEFVAYFTPRPIDNCERGPPRLVDPPCLRNVVGCRGLETVWDEQSNEHNKPRYRAPPVVCAFASGVVVVIPLVCGRCHHTALSYEPCYEAEPGFYQTHHPSSTILFQIQLGGLIGLHMMMMTTCRKGEGGLTLDR